MADTPSPLAQLASPSQIILFINRFLRGLTSLGRRTTLFLTQS